MKHRSRLVDLIDLRHVLVKLTALIDWDVFEREWSGFFPSATGRPATPPRLVAGLLYLQNAYRLSDEAVVARWIENPYYQHFTGETFFQHRPPIDPSSLTRWRNRIGEEGVEWLLTQTINAGLKSGAIDDNSLKRVAVDTTVMEKNIAHPTDARLFERARAQLVTLAREARVDLRQSYVGRVLQVPVHTGTLFSLNKGSLKLLRSALTQDQVRYACSDCQWGELEWWPNVHVPKTLGFGTCLPSPVFRCHKLRSQLARFWEVLGLFRCGSIAPTTFSSNTT
jgi:hypothetical protein